MSPPPRTLLPHLGHPIATRMQLPLTHGGGGGCEIPASQEGARFSLGLWGLLRGELFDLEGKLTGEPLVGMFLLFLTFGPTQLGCQASVLCGPGNN